MATITATVTQALTATITAASASATSSDRATPQAGILEGSNPTVYDPKNPIILFIIQAGIIIIFCRLLHYPLSLIRQPRVIAEVIGGILLGPSVFGRIPGFTNAIFPSSSIPNLSLVANLGLVLFLFLVGLEVDLRFVANNVVPALSVGAAGMALPFGLGCAIAWGLYNQFHDEPGTTPIAFGTYMLFVGVAMAITAFPVLCRILTELKLLSTPVGVIVLSAGVSNDVVGWILLALCVALVNAGSGLTALWVLLATVGFALFLFLVIQPVFLWHLRRTNSLTEGPSEGVIVITLLIALGSAFFTGVIGVHPIFGAFMAGLICPHQGGFAIKVTEKIEDLISALFLPLYFALSGLSTNLGLLDSGIAWAYVVAVIAVAFFGKFAGGTIAARLNGMVWRESFTIGVLMSCKGLVELIVLNIGLQAKILSTRTFTIFVVMALITTFATTPLTSWLYPPDYQRKLEAWKRGEIDWDTGKPTGEDSSTDAITVEKLQSRKVKTVLVYLRLDNMPTLMALVSLLGNKPADSEPRAHPSKQKQESVSEGPTTRRPVQVHGVRLLELTERNSSVMQVSEVDEFTAFDPVLNAFKVLGQLYNLAVSGEATVVPVSSYAGVLVNKAIDESSDLLLLPWSETGAMTETQTISGDSTKHKLESDSYASFVASAFAQASCNVALFINKGFSGSLKQRPSALNRSMSHMSVRRQAEPTLPISDRSHHIFVPFFGGADGRVALRLALQFAENPEVTVTFVHYELATNGTAHEQVIVTEKNNHDNVLSPVAAMSDSSFFATLSRSLPDELATRVVFETAQIASLDTVTARAQEECAYNPKNGGNLVLLGRSADNMPAQTCLGSAAQRVVDSGLTASLLVVQAKA
ncbi:hypothetical protein AMS68_003330 [Peltaster fructicola]|uniref:Cation/H+ exchanger transmembrane domain-containing protein n=1 Tax=Peltaster fructicola TaxID=286661 RepID=A0A6H0XSW8_9PEZI|nr:hypothetical protein AMS68_003330 [Peltaster fructicola]